MVRPSPAVVRGVQELSNVVNAVCGGDRSASKKLNLCPSQKAPNTATLEPDGRMDRSSKIFISTQIEMKSDEMVQ